MTVYQKYGCGNCADNTTCKRKECLYKDVLDKYESYAAYDAEKKKSGFYIPESGRKADLSMILKACGIA